MIGMVLLSFIRKYFLLRLYMAAILGNVILVTNSLIIKYLISQLEYSKYRVSQEKHVLLTAFYQHPGLILLGHLVKCSLMLLRPRNF